MENDNAERREFYGNIRGIIREEIALALEEYSGTRRPEAYPPPTEDEMVTVKELCTRLGISKPTLYNWQKNAKTKPLIIGNRQQVGRKVSYNITGIMALIKKHPMYFGGGRDYAFKDEVNLNTAQKNNQRFISTGSQIAFGNEVSQSDRNWYEAEKQRRANEAAAGDQDWFDKHEKIERGGDDDGDDDADDDA
jgi:hypothetical protein